MTNETELKEHRMFHPHSGKAFFIQLYFSGTYLASGTAFFVKSDTGPVMITARHNLTGKHNYNGKCLHTQGGIPNHGFVLLSTGIGPVFYSFDLYADDTWENPVWSEHPVIGERADIAALSLPELETSLAERSYIEIQKHWHRWDVGYRLNVIGFPYGLLSDIFPIWSSGFVASEPDVEFSNLPVFLMDCRTRRGQSGSPVFGRFVPGDHVKREGKMYVAQNEMYDFLGMYSGRINSESDLGLVWRSSTIEALAVHASKNGHQHIMENRRYRQEVENPFGVTIESLSGVCKDNKG